MSVPPEPPSLHFFSPHIGERFDCLIEGGATVALKLTHAGASECAAGEDVDRPFSLIFQGPSEPLLSQRVYSFRHPLLGGLDIFIVPIGRDDTGVEYEAVFN